MNIRSVYIEITNQCNLNCRDCYNASGLNKDTVEFSPASLDKFIYQMRELSSAESLDITLSGGEPLCHTQWEDILNVALKHTKNNITITVVTNSTIKNDKLYKLLASDPNFHVQFSLDGSDEITNDKMRGKGSFNLSLKNIDSLSYVNKPIFKMVISKFNIHQVKDYFEFALARNGIPMYSFVNHMGNAVSNWEDISISPNEKASVIKELITLYEEHSAEGIPPFATYICPLVEENEERSLLVKPNGDIHPCQMFYNPESRLGNVHDFSSSDFLLSFKNFADTLRKRSLMSFGCEKCLCGDQCQKGCPAMAVAFHGTLEADDGGCMFRKVQFAKINILEGLKKNAL